MWHWHKTSQVGERYKQRPEGWYWGACKNSRKECSEDEAHVDAVRSGYWMSLPTLTLTFKSLIGFLVILRRGCSNLWGWCKAEHFYLCAVFLLLISPWTYEIHLLSSYCYQTSYLYSKWGQKKEKKRAIDLYVSVICLGTHWAFTLGWLWKRLCLWLDLSGSGCVTPGTWGNKTTGNCQCLHAQRAVCRAVQ